MRHSRGGEMKIRANQSYKVTHFFKGIDLRQATILTYVFYSEKNA